MSELSKQALKVDNNTSFPNNTTNYITPAILRAFNVNVIDSMVDEIPFQAFTQSVLESLDSLDAFTASINTNFDALNAYTASNNTKWSNLGAQSGSWITESETGSFAKLDANQTFTGVNTFTNEMTASQAKFLSIQTGTLTATTIHTITESSSVIYSSGSNIFGDAATDSQTLYGSVNAVNQFTASGLHYPTADNGAKSFLQTDGAGNLSLQYVDAMFETVRNMSGITLAKGTPVYISGSTGDNGNAYVADASDASKMPAMYILGENLDSGDTGIALVGGLIEGVNTTGYPVGTIIYVAEGGGWTSSRPTGASSIVQVLGVVQKEGVGGQGVVINQLEAILPNIEKGYLWVGNGNNQPTNVSTASFATTGSNTFTGAQIIQNTLTVTGNTLVGDYTSNQYPALQTKVSTTTNPGNIYSTVGIKNDNDAVGSAGIYASTFTSFGSGLVTGIYGGGTGNKFAGDGGNTAIYLEGSRMQIVKDTIVSGSLAVSSSLTVNGSPVVVSSQTGSFITEAETGSFATTGSNIFVGNQTITGSFSTNGGATFGNTSAQYNSVNIVTSKTNFPGNVYNAFGIDTDNNGQWSAGLYVSSYNSFGSEPAMGLYGGGIGNSGANNVLESYGNLVRVNKNTEISGSLAVSASLTVNGSNVVVSSQTGSFITESETGSFATTGANTFNGNQTITGSLTTNGGATFGNRSAQYNNVSVVTSLTNYPGNLYNSIGIDVDSSSQYNGGFYISTYTAYGSNPAFGLYGGGNGNDGSNTILLSAGNLARITKNTQITGSLSVTGSIGVSQVMNLKGQDPLPSGTIGDLAVSGSNLYFYNGAWTQVI
jgi:hypothetical protein